jgi:hypothetical protein
LTEVGAGPHTSEKICSKGTVETLVEICKAIGEFLPFDKSHTHRDLFHANGEDYCDEEFVGQQMKTGVLDDDAMLRRTA